MKHWEARIKERCNPHIVTPSYYGDVDREYLIKFWGLNEPDIEWYELKLVED